MNHRSSGFLGLAAPLALLVCGFMPLLGRAQSPSKSDQWIHVRVESKEDSGETVHVNVPLELAVKVIPAIHHENLRDGKVRIDSAHLDEVDLRAILDAIRNAKDGEYVTVHSNEDNVRVAKNAGYLYIHVTERPHPEEAAEKKSGSKPKTNKPATAESKVEVKLPLKVVDALFSAGKDELDIVAALHALSSTGDMELVSVKDAENSVRIWIDSKNVAD